MSKIIICCVTFDTIENKRTEYTKKTFYSLLEKVNHETTKVVFIDNGSCKETVNFLKTEVELYYKVIYNKENKGTAEAINIGINKYASSGDYIVKMDNDVVVHEYGWADKMVRCFEADPKLGILGLKRKDLPNSPEHEVYKTRLKFLNHKEGEVWNVIEECSDVIGTCTMFSPELMKKVGYLYQPGVYAFDDCLMCIRSEIAGFYNAFYPSIEIDHIDEGNTPFTDWKRKYAGLYMKAFDDTKKMYEDNPETIYYNPFV